MSALTPLFCNANVTQCKTMSNLFQEWERWEISWSGVTKCTLALAHQEGCACSWLCFDPHTHLRMRFLGRQRLFDSILWCLNDCDKGVIPRKNWGVVTNTKQQKKEQLNRRQEDVCLSLANNVTNQLEKTIVIFIAGKGDGKGPDFFCQILFSEGWSSHPEMSGVLHRALGKENPRARVGLLRGKLIFR